MKKYKEDLKLIFQVLGVIAIYLFISFVKKPIPIYLLLGILVIYLFYDLYSKVQTKNGKTRVVFFSTKKDKRSKIISQVVGLMLAVGCLAYLIWTNTLLPLALVGIVSGLMIFMDGVFELPKREDY